MQRNKVRLLLLSFAIVCVSQTIPTFAWHIAQVAHPLRACLNETIGMAQSHPIEMLGGAAICAAITIYAARARHVPQAGAAPAAPNRRFFQPLAQFARALTHKLSSIKTRSQLLLCTMSNYVWPAPLERRVGFPVPGYQQADDTHLANVPYFNDPNNLIEQPIQFHNPHDNATVTVQQLRTSMQSGGQTCAYECIKNVSGCVGLIRGLSGHHLLTTDAAEEFFGANPPGILRQSINRSRKKYRLNEFWLTRLIVQNPAPLAAEARETIANYRTQYINLLHRFLVEQIDTLERTGQITFTADTINAYIAQANIENRYAGDHDRTQQQIDALYETMVQYIRNPRNIARYINIPNEAHLTSEDLNNAITNFNSVRPPNEQIPTNGENLEPEEIAQLCVQERTRPNSVIGQVIANIPVFTLPSTETPAPEPGSEAINPLAVAEETADIQHAIIERRIPQNGRIYTFTLGTADQAIRNNGHHISLILEMANGSRRYTIIDSLNNIQLFRGPAATVIRFLEGLQPNQFLHPSPEEMLRVINQLIDQVGQCEMAIIKLDDDFAKYETTFGNLHALPVELQQRIQAVLRHPIHPLPSGETVVSTQQLTQQNPQTPATQPQNQTPQISNAPACQKAAQ